jgi:hypothetical protein
MTSDDVVFQVLYLYQGKPLLAKQEKPFFEEC